MPNPFVERACDAFAREAGRILSQARGHSLSQGSAGAALLFTHFAERDGSRGLRGTAVAQAEAALASAAASLQQAPLSSGNIGLLGGLTGPHFAADAVGRAFDEPDLTEAAAEYDDMLVEFLFEPWDGHFDIVSGLSGVGLYAIERDTETSRIVARRVIDLLAQKAMRPRPGRMYWAADIGMNEASPMLQRTPSNCMDLGMAHGNAGVIAFLARAASAGIDEPRGRDMLHASATWLSECANDDAGASMFPYIANEPSVHSRCAWCYGDLGIAVALADAGDLTGDTGLTGTAQRGIERLAARSFDALGIEDAWLCHGTAGAAYIGARLAQRFGGVAVTRFADRMAGACLDTLEAAAQVAAQPAELGYLEGLAGALLAMSSMDMRSVRWDVPLGISRIEVDREAAVPCR